MLQISKFPHFLSYYLTNAVIYFEVFAFFVEMQILRMMIRQKISFLLVRFLPAMLSPEEITRFRFVSALRLVITLDDKFPIGFDFLIDSSRGQRVQLKKYGG